MRSSMVDFTVKTLQSVIYKSQQAYTIKSSQLYSYEETSVIFFLQEHQTLTLLSRFHTWFDC